MCLSPSRSMDDAMAGGTLGGAAHALALLAQLAEFAVARGCVSSPPDSRAPLITAPTM